jgi:hypothetical protein
MSDENLIGLAELIQQVKQELLTISPSNEQDVPFLGVDSVELELQVTVKKEGKGGVKIYVLEVGVGGSRDDVQKVKVTLSPLVNKATLLEAYSKKNSDGWAKLLEQSLKGVTKGNDEPPM